MDIRRPLATLAVVLMATATAAQDRPLVVAIYKSGTQQYFIDQARGFTEAAEELGFEARTINVELDSNLAISAVSDAIAAGAQGIAITVPDQALGPAIAAAAAEAGIPLVATDDAIVDGDGNPVPFVGFNGRDMGTKVGQTAAQLLQESGWLESGDYAVLVTEVSTLTVCMDRTNAAREQLAAVGVTDDRFITVPYDGTVDAALSAAGPVITANSTVNNFVVVACNDEGVLGTTNALRNAGYEPDNVIAVGLGAYEACRPWQEGIPTGFRAALYLSGEDVGEAAARALIANIQDGTPLPPETVANTTMVTPETWADVMPCD
ncbi:substrate-binding domain-containing protein [Rubellimicrobium sp. CFH 75288]|uniref:substrate-binding domain-containing protein n=1 Tax=Rubellimicrobium sp. CFH 75288 TaxID=2697034 RepID=UPI0014135232|nr:substrate-binding domain-containing protein [Rubellimicrobium sp. CFH 75288]NAZ35323.1 substrate-binding domain-containing protein [Rubellimicrobium sp. CFH 75288]